jgi:hypothetical protein
LFDRPGAEVGPQPDVVPAEEGRIGVVVVPGQALAQVGVGVGLARLGDAGHRQVLDQDVRRQHHRAGQRLSRSLKRWILPVAVLGSSLTNSIWRGYL